MGRIEVLEPRTLLSAVSFDYQVNAINPAGSSALVTSSAVVIPTRAAAPTNVLAAPDAATQTITVTWTDSSDLETGYVIKRGTDGVHFTRWDKLPANTTTYTDHFATPGVTYYYQVKAVNAADSSSLVTSSPVVIPTRAPAPTNVLATPDVATQTITVTWNDASDLETGYVVKRGTDGVRFTRWDKLPANGATYTDHFATAGVTYYYQVKAINAAGSSALVTSLPVMFPPLPGGVSFGGAQAIAIGSLYVTVGDFNRDGKSDLVTANYGSNALSILLGKGDGTFQDKIDSPAGSYSMSATVGDFNRDGKSDLAVVAGHDSVSILLGNGDGTFQAKTDYAVGVAPSSVTVGDFNGDGISDLAVANCMGNTVSILLGNGDGTFQAKTDYAVGSYPLSATVGDFNGDGKSDLATANASYSDTVSILLGNGDGTFQGKTDYAVGSNPQSITVDDFNGDGKSDLATAGNYSNAVSILLGNGDGTFQAKTDYAVGSYPGSVTVGDFNGDGKSDLATACVEGSTVSILLGNGDGSFHGKIDYAANSYLKSVAVGDFNRDGKSDLAVASGGGGVSILLNTTPNTPPNAVPHAPTDVLATSNVATQTITVTWADASDFETGYVVKRGTDGVHFTRWDKLSANATTYTDNYATPGVIYYYQVKAISMGGPSGFVTASPVGIGLIGIITGIVWE